MFVHPYLAPLPVAATAVAWRRERSARLRLIAIGTTVVAVGLALAYVAFG